MSSQPSANIATAQHYYKKFVGRGHHQWLIWERTLWDNLGTSATITWRMTLLGTTTEHCERLLPTRPRYPFGTTCSTQYTPRITVLQAPHEHRFSAANLLLQHYRHLRQETTYTVSIFKVLLQEPLLIPFYVFSMWHTWIGPTYSLSP